MNDAIARHGTSQKRHTPPYVASPAVARVAAGPGPCFWAACNGELTWSGFAFIWGHHAN